MILFLTLVKSKSSYDKLILNFKKSFKSKWFKIKNHYLVFKIMIWFSKSKLCLNSALWQSFRVRVRVHERFSAAQPLRLLKVALDGGTLPGDTLQILPLCAQGTPFTHPPSWIFQEHSVGHSFTKNNNWNCNLFFLKKICISDEKS